MAFMRVGFLTLIFWFPINQNIKLTTFSLLCLYIFSILLSHIYVIIIYDYILYCVEMYYKCFQPVHYRKKIMYQFKVSVQIYWFQTWACYKVYDTIRAFTRKLFRYILTNIDASNRTQVYSVEIVLMQKLDF